MHDCEGAHAVRGSILRNREGDRFVLIEGGEQVEVHCPSRFNYSPATVPSYWVTEGRVVADPGQLPEHDPAAMALLDSWPITPEQAFDLFDDWRHETGERQAFLDAVALIARPTSSTPGGNQ